MTPTTPELPPVTDAQKAAILSAPRTAEAHRRLMAGLPALHRIQTGGRGGDAPLRAGFTAAAWNLERGLFPEASAALLAAQGVDAVLLSEMDNGMARTGQRDTTAAMAQALGMHFAYGVEFFELGLGGITERALCREQVNRLGWHGNAILSRAPFRKLALIRLDDDGRWFAPQDGADPGQPRIGGRMALAAVVEAAFGPLCLVSTHLESSSGAELRAAQFDRLLRAVDAFAPGLPVLIGGDLNTGNQLPPDWDWRREDLFAMAEERGYGWALTPAGITTRSSLITPHRTRRMKLDWFCTKGLAGTGRIVVAEDAHGTPLSDHECIVAEAIGPAAG
ncbi:endonuclease/exonuclease/phosphatase family protein [Halovulum marinum]|uniref:endonuclease/exonuclease/phosphatase family protein n=1 Tax=Halovulum marinum TaxID=2662447 RepID=UPI001F374342|nr:endonuclease/exonuclease/phosphatase family protein [Halovulum marinum]